MFLIPFGCLDSQSWWRDKGAIVFHVWCVRFVIRVVWVCLSRVLTIASRGSRRSRKEHMQWYFLFWEIFKNFKKLFKYLNINTLFLCVSIYLYIYTHTGSVCARESSRLNFQFSFCFSGVCLNMDGSSSGRNNLVKNNLSHWHRQGEKRKKCLEQAVNVEKSHNCFIWTLRQIYFCANLAE